MSTRIDINDLLVWTFRDEDVEGRVDAHPDAVTVYWAVLALPPMHCGMVRRFARSGGAPDWHASGGQTVSLAMVRRTRAAYTEWIRALTVLQRTLDGILSDFTVTGPTLAETPWTTLRLSA